MCGIIGIIGTSKAPLETYQGLLLLQHRGQDAAGILNYDFEKHVYSLEKNQGYVDKVFTPESLQAMKGQMSIGHTRYSTVGSLDLNDVQPMTLNYPYGLGIAHNGNLVNFDKLKNFLNEKKKRFLFSKNDGEILINLISDHLSYILKKNEVEHTKFHPEILFSAIRYLFEYAKGGYSIVGTIAPFGLFACKDPNGIRPLLLGKKTTDEGDSFCLSSESFVLEFLGYKVQRDLEPGEIIFISKKGKLHSSIVDQQPKKQCMFEWVYFSNPESTLDGKSIYTSRLNLGKSLSHKIQKLIDKNEISPDFVVPVPETSKIAATAISENLSLPLRPVLNKNRYIQRSFILNTQDSRENAVKLKLLPIKEDIEGKNLLVIDDSIVRGTTSKRIVKMLKDAGAKEIYFASTCPPITHPCGYGIDFPNSEDLIAFNKTEEEITDLLGCNRVIYQTEDDLKDVLGDEICSACLTGKYPTGGEFLANK